MFHSIAQLQSLRVHCCSDVQLLLSIELFREGKWEAERWVWGQEGQPHIPTDESFLSLTVAHAMATITSLANSVVWLFAPTFEAIHSLGDEFCIPPPPPRQCLSSAAPSLTRITFLWQFYPVTRVGTQAGCRTVFSRERRSASGTK